MERGEMVLLKCGVMGFVVTVKMWDFIYALPLVKPVGNVNSWSFLFMMYEIMFCFVF